MGIELEKRERSDIEECLVVIAVKFRTASSLLML